MPRPSPAQLQVLAERNSEWCAAITILASRAFSIDDDRIWRHVFTDGPGIDFRSMHAEGTWSSGERALIEIAGNLFNGSLDVYLGSAMVLLSPSWAEIAFRGMRARAGL